MQAIVQWFLTYVLVYKYAAIFVITFLGSFAFPVPSGTVVMASAFVSGSGYMNFYLVLATAIAGNTLGDNGMYWLARKHGHRITARVGLDKAVDSPRFKSVERSFSDHPIATVFLGQFSPGLSPIVNFIVGLGKMEYKKYLLYEFTGELAQVSINSTLGFTFGNNWQYLSSLFGRFIIIIVTVVAITYLLIWKRIIAHGARRRQ